MGDIVANRTDLAVERFKSSTNSAFSQTEEIDGEFTINKIHDGKNTYITLTLPSLIMHGGFFEEAEKLIAKLLSELLPDGEGCVLVAGLGNREITPDALGPDTVKRVLATRHITKDLAKEIGLRGLSPVAAIAPSVLGKTGVEAAEIIKAVSSSIKPKAVIVIDALCAAEINRLGCTIQLSSCGITPGSGVKNSRREISKNTLGIPVISIGMPTVIDATDFFKSRDAMVVTPKDIDLLIDRAATLIGNSINICLQSEIEPEILRALV